MVGTGVVGGILAGCLLRKGEEVIVVDASSQRLSQLNRSGLEIRDPKGFLNGGFTAKARKTLSVLTDLRGAPVDALFVCVKACVLEEILPRLEQVHRPEMAVISFQNGLDTEEFLAERLGRESVFRGVVNYAGRLLEDGAVEVGFFNKPNYIGALVEGKVSLARRLAEILTGAGLETEYSDSIRRHVWEKVILNSAMSPISALTGLTMRELMDSPRLCRIAEGIVREGIEVAEACGISFPEDFFEHCMGYLHKGGRHKPSMLVDVEAGRRTEIDFLNGKIYEHGRRLSVPTPFNQAIAALVKGLEASLAGRRGQNG